MTVGHRDFDGAINIEIVSLTISGYPSGISAVVVEIFYGDGSSRLEDLQPNSNEMIYETFIEEFNQLKAFLVKRAK